MEQYRKKEGNKYYLKKLNKDSNEFEWIEIRLESSNEPKDTLLPNEKVIQQPSHDYYFDIVYPDYVSKSKPR